MLELYGDGDGLDLALRSADQCGVDRYYRHTLRARHVTQRSHKNLQISHCFKFRSIRQSTLLRHLLSSYDVMALYKSVYYYYYYAMQCKKSTKIKLE